MLDLSLTHDLNSYARRHDGFEDGMTAYASASQLLFLALLAVLFVTVWGRLRAEARRAAVAAGASAGLALVVGALVSALVDRPRPFVAHPSLVHLFAPHAADAGFPSDHATAAFAIAVAIFLRRRAWGAPVLVAAALLAFARVAIGVHYPADVLAGAVIGTLAALALHAPVLRSRLDRFADLLGALVDGGARRVGTIAQRG